MLKAGTGVGLAYVAGGEILRGAQGAAGEIGHTHVPGHDDIVCSCGKRGCLQAVAGGQRMADRLTAAGIPCANTAEVAALARGGTPEAIAMVRERGPRDRLRARDGGQHPQPVAPRRRGRPDGRPRLPARAPCARPLYREANTLAT